MPLVIEVYRQAEDRWVEAGRVRPGDPPWSLSDHRPDGTRELYLFECAADDSASTIFRSAAGVDIATAESRLVFSDRSQWILMRKLRRGESFDMEVVTDVSSQPRHIRFTHC